jgi:hypothetical protein
LSTQPIGCRFKFTFDSEGPLAARVIRRHLGGKDFVSSSVLSINGRILVPSDSVGLSLHVCFDVPRSRFVAGRRPLSLTPGCSLPRGEHTWLG